MLSRGARSLLVLGASTLAAAACGGAAPESKSPASTTAPPSADADREPTSIDQAEAQIAEARAALGDFEAKPGGDAPAQEPAETPSSRKSEPEAGREADKAPADACASSCRALSSMRRAVGALCRMTGDDDARCTGARTTLGESESRVARCHCGA